MDFLKLIEDKDIVSFAENYSYDKIIWVKNFFNAKNR